MLKKYLITGVLALAVTFTGTAKEGMWIPMLLGALNEADMQANGMRLSAADIYSVNKSSLKDGIVHFGGGCTAEVISDRGLILTNHHCGYSQIQSHSSVENDYLTDGFWAMSQKEELQNPGLTATFIVRMEDVTDFVLKGVTDDMSEESRYLKTMRNIEKISKKATEGTHYKAIVRPFFYGNEYYMFITETFDDVRLVGAPPSSIGKFGYDEDNWMWPRHTGDFSIFRIYAGKGNQPAPISDQNVPYKPKHHFPVSLEGVKEGDFSMVYGFPGRTQQYLTSFAVDYTMNVSNPAKIKMRETSLGIIDADMRSSDKIRIQYAAKQSRISNAYKKYIGENRGLKKLNALDVKREREKEFQKLATQQSRDEYMNLLSEFEQLYSNREKYELARDYWIEYWYYGPEIIRFSSRFKDVIENYDQLEQEGKVDEAVENLRKGAKGYFKNYNLDTDKKVFAALGDLYSNGVDPTLAPEIFAKVVNGKYKGDWNKYRDYVYGKTIFSSEESVNDFLDGFSAKSLKKLKKDPAYQLMESIYSSYFDKVRGTRDGISIKIDAKMRLYVKGTMELVPNKKYWSDANSTLRLTYGKIEGSTPRDGMAYKPFSTLDGVMEKYIKGDRDFDAPDKLLELYAKKDYGQYGEGDVMPVCFTGSNHTTGGNSGSPVINGEGHLIGLNFDRSWESTMSDIMYDPDRCRNIAVDIRYVLFIVDKFAGAKHLVDEMTLVDAAYRESEYKEMMKEKINEMTMTVKSNPQDVDGFVSRAKAYEELGNKQDALNDYNVALNIDAKNEKALIARGMLLAEMGKNKEALKDFSAAIKVNSKSYEAYFQRGLCYAEKEEYSKGIKDFTKCTQIDRNQYKAWYNRGICLIKTGKTDQGCSDLKFAETLGGKGESQVYRAICVD